LKYDDADFGYFIPLDPATGRFNINDRKLGLFHNCKVRKSPDVVKGKNPY